MASNYWSWAKEDGQNADTYSSMKDGLEYSPQYQLSSSPTCSRVGWESFSGLADTSTFFVPARMKLVYQENEVVHHYVHISCNAIVAFSKESRMNQVG